MNRMIVPFAGLTLLAMTSFALALPAPYTPEELDAAATLVVDAEVTAVECVGAPVVTEEKTVTTYKSTLMVSNVIKGDAVTEVVIMGTTTVYVGEAPVGAWEQPALKKGMKGKFYLKDGADEGTHTYVWWNAATEADDSAPEDLPTCAADPVDPCTDGAMNGDETDVDCGGGTCTPCADGKACKAASDCTSGTCTDNVCAAGGNPPAFESPNPCWDDKCAAESGACANQASCVAWNECYKKADEEQQACFQAVSDANPDDIDENGNHVTFRALQECGWENCNDPNAGSCGDAGKGGAADRCGQWDDSWACNCDSACEQYGDCCADLATVCLTCNKPGKEGAANRCGQYDQTWSCNCDAECAAQGDCCPDKVELCGEDEPTDPLPCEPECTGKTCGGDGCGGVCGTCADNEECSDAGTCVASEPEPACEDNCTAGETGCAGTDTWTCQLGESGCLEKVKAETCEACENGACVAAPPTDPPVTTPTDEGGCSGTDTPAHGAALILLALLGLMWTTRRRTNSVDA